jgi:hypothetical protein
MDGAHTLDTYYPSASAAFYTPIPVFSTLMDALMPILSSRPIVIVLCAVLSACSLPPAKEASYLPPGVFGAYEDNATGALNQASWAFADPKRTSNDPISAARAVIAVEYLAGELSSNPRWVELSAVAKTGMVRARADTRRVLGIAPDISSQWVIDALLRFISTPLANNEAAIASSLTQPVFMLPAPQTLRILSNLPYIASANVATIQASNEAFLNRR